MPCMYFIFTSGGTETTFKIIPSEKYVPSLTLSHNHIIKTTIYQYSTIFLFSHLIHLSVSKHLTNKSFLFLFYKRYISMVFFSSFKLIF